MPTVIIEPELYKRVEQVAREHNTSTKEIFSQATRYYLWELSRRKISEESNVYRQRHAQLKTEYLGQYIAMHDGQVVDSDSDFHSLYRRVRQRFGHTPVMITLVEDASVS
ncbi:MAG TPA: DUF5678 domain-containing protein [Anaerolineae bacterium]